MCDLDVLGVLSTCVGIEDNIARLKGVQS